MLQSLRRIDGLFADLFNSEALDEVVCSLEVVRVFPVVLEKERARFEGLLAGLNRDENVGLSNSFTRGATNHDLPTALLADEADVFDRRFSAVARAADDAHLHLVGRIEIFEAAFEFDA